VLWEEKLKKKFPLVTTFKQNKREGEKREKGKRSKGERDSGFRD
jgi:hypothetical protein